MKVALLTDTHAGIRGDSILFADYQDRFYEKEFFPECSKRGISIIIHGGDFFDRRQYSSHKTLHRLENGFIRLMKEYNMHMHILVGNHDVALRSSNHVNTPQLILGKYEFINTYESPVYLEDMNLALIPWINNANYAETVKFMQDTKASHVFGHFEIAGFEMHKGSICDTGLNRELFDRFANVFSGHFHTKSVGGNITYLGTSMEFTWSDYNDPKGWHVFDTETGELEFIPSQEHMFYRLTYSEAGLVSIPHISSIDELRDKYVKLYVEDKGDLFVFENALQSLYNIGCADLQIIEKQISLNTELTDEVIEKHARASNLDIIKESILNLEDNIDKDRVLRLVERLYSEATAND